MLHCTELCFFPNIVFLRGKRGNLSQESINIKRSREGQGGSPPPHLSNDFRLHRIKLVRRSIKSRDCLIRIALGEMICCWIRLK